jgi:hypothetical protein
MAVTLLQLKLVEQSIRRYRDYPIREIASKTPCSVGIVQKAMFLINCRPNEWSQVVSGSLTVGAAYEKATSRQTTSFEG